MPLVQHKAKKAICTRIAQLVLPRDQSICARHPTGTEEAAGELVQAACVIPTLLVASQEVERYFNNVCSACHDQSVPGTEYGPSFKYGINNLRHHGDQAFQMAAQNGVRHHQRLCGGMSLEKATAQVARIAVNIRELQEVNGVTYRPQNM